MLLVRNIFIKNLLTTKSKEKEGKAKRKKGKDKRREGRIKYGTDRLSSQDL